MAPPVSSEADSEELSLLQNWSNEKAGGDASANKPTAACSSWRDTPAGLVTTALEIPVKASESIQRVTGVPAGISRATRSQSEVPFNLVEGLGLRVEG